MSKPLIKMTEEDFRMHCDDSDGLCLACGAIRYGGTEPDAEGYFCEDCEEERVQGFENALIDGNIEISEDRPVDVAQAD